MDLSVLRASHDLRLLVIGLLAARRSDRRPDRAASPDVDGPGARDRLGDHARGHEATGDPPVPLVFALAATLAAGATLDNVTRSAIVPALAGDRLRAALSITYGLNQVSAVAGPALGGLMIAALGTGSAYTAQAVGL